MPDPKEILKEHISNFASLNEEQFDYFFSHFNMINLQKGQMLITEGDSVDHEYFVVDGCLKAFYLNDNMKMFILQFAMPNWWVSDFDALYSKNRATINVDCITSANILSISNEDREKICKEIHEVEHFFRWRTNKGYVAAQKRLLSFMDNDVKFRYEELLALYPQLYNLVPKHLIASYLGVTRETLSRLRQ
ncbi:Crp/Fnr family transcriptional regulator [Chryseobacterium chendengshani]|uniref:Crp/Fnr family transcriptional regulator n=1 Tax=Chryseobacterium sp. LJ668 TaxID=2864040 RepID=UPI001C690262|nr:Crp/Fnr family transcriptional regulator [Chryseobacterium sp. LJ668]MBW8523663.1 Crp/Fnr family transcriptional regulator [Chryseobacterium sp. LJ668]QYK15944.1 Crp/Fnr family transcriptional regulator [Chryseobacterium sp. LJ668]